jgi:hypothetical protein
MCCVKRTAGTCCSSSTLQIDMALGKERNQSCTTMLATSRMRANLMHVLALLQPRRRCGCISTS